jgi:peroxiredoxin
MTWQLLVVRRTGSGQATGRASAFQKPLAVNNSWTFSSQSYVAELDRLVPELRDRGVEAIAISSDTEARAREAQEKWNLTQLNVGHSLAIATARTWGLYISSSRGKTLVGIDEPALFSEPGVFLVRPDRTLYWASVQSMPFARPHFREILAALDFAIARDYPARGEA